MRHDKKYCASLAAAVLLAALVICQGAAYGLTPAVGEKAADFTLPTQDGKSLTLSDLKGKRAAVLVFFATWCPYCMEEVPAVKSFVEASKDKGVLVYGVDIQQKKDIVGKFIKDRDINYRVLLDEDGKTANAYGVTGIPNVVGIDWKGVVRYRDYRMPKDTEGFIKQLTDGLALAKENPPQAPASTQAQDPADPPSDNNKDQAAKSDPYPLDHCVVSGKKLGADGATPVVFNYQGRELRFCSADCVEAFKKDPALYLKKIDDAIIEQQKPFYALDTCPVSGDNLGGDMGKPVDFVYNNRLVRFCCPACIEPFKKEPAKYLAMIDVAAIAKQKPNYPLDTCMISGKKLDAKGAPVDRVIDNRLVRFCCPNCVAAVEKDPVTYFKKIDEAAQKAASAATAQPSGKSAQKDESDNPGDVETPDGD